MHHAKVDNSHLHDKQQLRRKLLEEMKLMPLRILDLCAGEGSVWRKLRTEYPVLTYTPVDQQRRQAAQIHFKVDGRFIQALDLRKYNVIDVDTYGEPWAIWSAVFTRIRTRTAVFLTRGLLNIAGHLSHEARQVVGIPRSWQYVPCNSTLAAFADRYQLSIPSATVYIAKGYRVVHPRVTYYALAIERKENHETQRPEPLSRVG